MKKLIYSVFYFIFPQFCLTYPTYPFGNGNNIGNGNPYYSYYPYQSSSYPMSGCTGSTYPGYSFIGWPNFGLGAGLGGTGGGNGLSGCGNSGYPGSFIGSPTFGLGAGYGGNGGYPGSLFGNYNPYNPFTRYGSGGLGTGANSNVYSSANNYGGIGGASSSATSINLGGLFG